MAVAWPRLQRTAIQPADARSTPDNVAQLGLAWFADFDTRRGQESTPLVIDGVIYVTTAWSKVYAFDAKTGQAAVEVRPEGAG